MHAFQHQASKETYLLSRNHATHRHILAVNPRYAGEPTHRCGPRFNTVPLPIWWLTVEKFGSYALNGVNMHKRGKHSVPFWLGCGRPLKISLPVRGRHAKFHSSTSNGANTRHQSINHQYYHQSSFAMKKVCENAAIRPDIRN